MASVDLRWSEGPKPKLCVLWPVPAALVRHPESLVDIATKGIYSKELLQILSGSQGIMETRRDPQT